MSSPLLSASFLEMVLRSSGVTCIVPPRHGRTRFLRELAERQAAPLIVGSADGRTFTEGQNVRTRDGKLRGRLVVRPSGELLVAPHGGGDPLPVDASEILDAGEPPPPPAHNPLEAAAVALDRAAQRFADLADDLDATTSDDGAPVDELERVIERMHDESIKATIAARAARKAKETTR